MPSFLSGSSSNANGSQIIALNGGSSSVTVPPHSTLRLVSTGFCIFRLVTDGSNAATTSDAYLPSSLIDYVGTGVNTRLSATGSGYLSVTPMIHDTDTA